MVRKKGTVETVPSCTNRLWGAGTIEIVINTTANGWASATVDRQNGAAAHEFGHVLGLAHSSSSTVLMYSYYNVAPTTPQTDDKNGVNSLYK
jgi:predicted Zn-dependent protease